MGTKKKFVSILLTMAMVATAAAFPARIASAEETNDVELTLKDTSTAGELQFDLSLAGSSGYLATFDDLSYENYIWNNGKDAEGGMEYYQSSTFEAKYNETEKVMDVTAKFGYVCAGMVVKFPEEKALKSGEDVILNIKLDSTVKYVKIYMYGGTGTLYGTSDVKAGWNKIVIPDENLTAALGTGTFKGVQIALYDNAEGTRTQTSQTANISLGKIYYEGTLVPASIDKSGYLATFDDLSYEKNVWNNGKDAEGGMEYYQSSTFEAKYNETEKVMDVTAKFGYICAGMVVKFPEEKALESGKDVILNIKLDSTVKYVRIYMYGGTGNLYASSDVTEGWNEIVIPDENLTAALGTGTFQGVQIALYDNAAGGRTQTSQTANISLGKIYYEGTLPIPEETWTSFSGAVLKNRKTLTNAEGAAIGMQVSDTTFTTAKITLPADAETGDIITISGVFQSDTYSFTAKQISCQWDGTSWSIYEPVLMDPVKVTGESKATAIYLRLSENLEGVVWENSIIPLQGKGCILYNGEAITIAVQKGWAENMICIQPRGVTPVKGDTITIAGQFKYTNTDGIIDIAPYTIWYDGTTDDGTPVWTATDTAPAVSGDLNYDEGQTVSDLVRFKWYLKNDVAKYYKAVTELTKDDIVDDKDLQEERCLIVKKK